MDPGTINDDRISIRDFVLRVRSWFKYLVSNWMGVTAVGAGIALLFFLYQILRSPVYTAETTFVLETVGEGKLGQISSPLSSIVDLDVGRGGQGSEMFQIDNIMELYRSRKMLFETFLASRDFDGERKRLITRFAERKERLQKWREKTGIDDLSFETPADEFKIVHDSILFEVIDEFREDNLVAEKLSRKLTILSVRINHKDNLFAKAFNEELVRNVNQFYFQTKTKKTGENLRVLENQRDSLKRVLDETLEEYERVAGEAPNANPYLNPRIARAQKLQIDMETSAAVYEEILKNLEIAKISYRNNTPLIQVIDEPRLPLPDDKYRLFKLIVLSVIIGGVLSVIYFLLRLVYQSVLEEE